jgi:hypothetical protein
VTGVQTCALPISHRTASFGLGSQNGIMELRMIKEEKLLHACWGLSH